MKQFRMANRSLMALAGAGVVALAACGGVAGEQISAGGQLPGSPIGTVSLTDAASTVLIEVERDDLAQKVVDLFPQMYLTESALRDRWSEVAEEARAATESCYAENFLLGGADATNWSRYQVNEVLAYGDGTPILKGVVVQKTDLVPLPTAKGGVSSGRAAPADEELELPRISPEIVPNEKGELPDVEVPGSVSIPEDSPDQLDRATTEFEAELDAVDVDGIFVDDLCSDVPLEFVDQLVLGRTGSRLAASSVAILTDKDTEGLAKLYDQCDDEAICRNDVRFIEDLYQIHVEVVQRLVASGDLK